MHMSKCLIQAVKMLALMVITFMLFWLPYHIYHAFNFDVRRKGEMQCHSNLILVWSKRLSVHLLGSNEQLRIKSCHLLPTKSTVI